MSGGPSLFINQLTNKLKHPKTVKKNKTIKFEKFMTHKVDKDILARKVNNLIYLQ